MKFTRSFAVGALALMVLAGCSSAEEAPEEVEEPTLTAEEAWVEVFPDTDAAEVAEEETTRGQATVIDQDPSLSKEDKLKVALTLPEEEAATLTDESAPYLLEEMMHNIDTGWVLENPHGEFILRQLLIGSTLTHFYDEGTPEHEMAALYAEVTEELYLDWDEASQSEESKERLEQLQEQLQEMGGMPELPTPDDWEI